MALRKRNFSIVHDAKATAASVRLVAT